MNSSSRAANMVTSQPLWYQFSLWSLLLWTLFVAVLCSIGVCTHWFVSAVIAVIAAGGIVGRIVAGTRLGFATGVVYGTLFAVNGTARCADLHLPQFSAKRRLNSRAVLGRLAGRRIRGDRHSDA